MSGMTTNRNQSDELIQTSRGNNMTATLSKHDLNQFTGSTKMYRHWTRKLLYTEGCEYLCANGAAWLIDAIASYQGDKRLRTEDLKYFQLWELTLLDNSPYMATLTCRADSDVEPAITQNIEYTDCPFDIKLYVELGSADGVNEHMVCMLPSER